MKAIIKKFLSGIFQLNLNEFCYRCGNDIKQFYIVEENLSKDVHGTYPVLCIPCFNELATKRGHSLRWKPECLEPHTWIYSEYSYM